MSQKQQVSKEELMKKQKEQEPSVEIDLPSGGKVYSKETPMGDGKLTMRYMKGADEEILISPKYAKSGRTFDVLLSRLIMEANFKPEELTVADKENLVLSARVISLGDEFEVEEIECEKCEHVAENIQLKLSDIKENKILHEPDKLNTNRFTTELPQTGHEVTLKVITGKDQRFVTEQYEKNKYVNDGEILTYSIAQAIVNAPNVEGDNFGMKVRFYKDLPIMDARHLRQFLSECSGGTDYNISYKCEECEHVQDITIDFGRGFFF